MQHSTTPVGLIVLSQNGQCVSLDEESMQAIGGDVACTSLVASNDPLHGYNVAKTRVSLLASGNGSRIPNAGLIPALHQIAAFKGLHFQLDVEVPISSLSAPVNLDYLAYPQLAQFALTHERGIIRVPTNFSAAELIYDFYLAYPTQRMVVLGNHVRQLDKIQQQLSAKVNNVQSVNGRRSIIVHDDEEMPRVTCATYLEASEIDLATSDIVLLLNAYACVQDRVQVVLERVDARFRLFGLAGSNRKVAPSEEDMGMAVFGPEILDLMGFRQSRREVNVAWISHINPKTNTLPIDARFWWSCYWHNERRNRLMKQLARALINNSELHQSRFSQLADWLPSSRCRSRSVTILVDRPMHAVALAKMLPDWTVFTGDVPLNGCPGSFRHRVDRQRRQWLLGDKQIVLAGAASQFRGETSDVVIWAGGGTHAAPIPKAWLGGQYGTDKPLLIIDFLDQHNGIAEEWVRKREQEYHHLDIYPPGISPSQGRLAKFLNRQ